MPAFTKSAPTLTLRKLAVRGAAWTVVGFGGAQVLRFAFNLVLTRLLYPELFGLMALAFTVIAGLNLFSDIGTLAIVVSNPRGADREFLNTVWTLQILRGLVLATVFFLIASPVAAFYHDPRLEWVIRTVGLISIIAGFNAMTLFVLRRRMQVRQLVSLELGSQALSGAAMIVWAWISPGIVALIAGSFVSAAVRLIWGHLLEPRMSHRIALDHEALRILYAFGRWLWFAAILGYLASQVDRLILGKMLTLQMLGIYGVALAISELPRGLLGALSSYIIFPAYSQWSGFARADFRARIARSRWPLLAVAGVVVVALTVGGDVIIRLLYDRRYAQAGWMLPLLAIGIWPSALYQTIEGALVTVGKPRYGAFANLAKIIFTAAGIPLAFLWGGVAAAVMVVALNDMPAYGPIGYGLWREKLSNFGQDLKATALLLAVLSALLLARRFLGLGFPFQGASW